MSFIIAMIGQTQQNVNLAMVKFLINGANSNHKNLVESNPIIWLWKQ